MLVDKGEFHGFIFNRLCEEHRDIRAMLDALRELGDDGAPGRYTAFKQLAQAIRLHARAEEEILWPVLDGSYELGHHVREDTKEHHAIDALLRAMEHDWPSGPMWIAQLSALEAALEHHFRDEEDVVFPRAHAVIGDPQAQDLLYAYEQDREFLARRR